ncbi:MAG: hypothetical protein IPP85_16455 [Propionivibrio sp.]|nr:hypothetical protein [Propionivibrio sp.]
MTYCPPALLAGTLACCRFRRLAAKNCGDSLGFAVTGPGRLFRRLFSRFFSHFGFRRRFGGFGCFSDRRRGHRRLFLFRRHGFLAGNGGRWRFDELGGEGRLVLTRDKDLDILNLLLRLLVHDHRQNHGGQTGKSNGANQAAACAFF